MKIIFRLFKVQCILCLFAIPVLTATAQNCTDTAKKINYSSPGYRLNLSQHLVVANDTVLLGGSYNDNAFDRGIYLIKIKPGGDVAVSKKINLPDIQLGDNNTANGLLHLQNGNILLAAGRSAGVGYNSDTSFSLTLLNADGNIIWSKRYTDDAHNSTMAVKSVKEMPDHDLVIMLNFVFYEHLVDSLPQFGTAFIRLDALGNVLWSNYYSIGPFVNQFEGIAFEILQDKIYCVGLKMYDDFYLGYPEYEHNLWAAKLDAVTGKLIDSRSYLNMRIQTSISGYVLFNYYFGNLIYTGKGQFIYTDRHQAFAGNGLPGLKKMIMDTNLVFSNAVFYKATTLGFGYSPRMIANTNKEIFVYSNSADANCIAKFDSSNNPIRQLQMPYPAGGTQPQTSVIKPIGLKQKYISLINASQNSGTTNLQLWQMADDVALSDCYGSDTPFVQWRSYPVTEVKHSFAIETRSIVIQPTNITVTSSSLPIITTTECVVQSNCTNLSVTGANTICNTKNTYTYTAHKNSNCAKHVLWQIDTSAIAVAQQLNDSTYTVKFKKNWSGYLYASVSSCAILKDSIKINVFAAPDTINLGSDKIICSGDSLKLNAGNGFKEYHWQNGSSDSIFTVTKTGIYFITATDHCGNWFSDTINVTVDQPAAINLGNDTSICSNQPLVLNAGDGFTHYLWSTGNTASTQLVANAGNYSVIATNSYGCLSKDSIDILTIYPSPIISLNKTRVLCLSQNNTLTPGNGFAGYLWQDGSTDSVFIVNHPGWYKVTVSNNFNCYASDSVKITKVAMPPAHFLNADTAICRDENIIIAPRQIFPQYLWSTGAIDSHITVIPPAHMWLLVTDNNNCKGVDSINVTVKTCPVYFYTPNAFTPDRNGVNDIFKPLISGKIERYEFSIYNRYGQLIFTSKNSNEGWNGTVKGLPQEAGTFIWTCIYKFKNQPAEQRKGTVILIR